MKILIVHQHFNTPEKGGALRSYFLAKALIEYGHQVVVISGHNSNEYKTESYEGIEVHYLPVPYENAFGFYKRINSFISFLRLASKFALAQQGIDRCYTMSTPLTVGLVGVWLKWRRGIPFVFEVGDLWPEAPIQLGFINNPLLKYLLFRLEKLIYRQSHAIVALSVPMKKIIEQKVPQKIVYLLPNMADLDFFVPETKSPELEKKYSVENRFVVSYIGSIGYANGLEFLLDCARILESHALPVTLLICGEGAVLPALKSTTQKLGIKNVIFVPFTNRDGVKEVMNITDAAFISYRPKAVLETGSPNKYFDALGAGKLIITNFDGWIRSEIEQNACGFAIDYTRPQDLTSKLQPLLQNKALLQKMRMNAHALSQQYSRKKLGKI